MKKTLLLTLALTSAMALGGCGQTREDRAVNGALLGGATGALIGGAASGRAGGALAGGIIGAASGGIRSNLTLVGEHGRELVSLPPGSMVHSNPDSERMLSQGGGGTMRLVVSMDKQMPHSLSRELIRWLKFTVRTTGGGDVQVAFGDS
jgi:hypothetical protein